MKRPVILLLWLIGGIINLMAQVTVIPTVSPPFSPYFEDYLQFQNQEVMILVNNSNRRLELKLTARIQGDNGFYAFIKEDFQPATPIILEPLESKSLTPLSPEFSLFNINAIETNVPQRQQQGIVASGILPEGNYTFCVQALDYRTSVPLSPPSPSGCLMVPISYMQPPVLLNPVCESSVFSRQPSFVWSPPVGNPGRSSFQYDLILVKMNPGQEPNEAMNRAVEYRAGNPLIIENLPTNNYVYRMSDPPLENGATYAMQVIVKDPAGEKLFENNGRSAVCTFEYRENGDDNNPIIITDPSLQGPPGLFTQVSGQLRYHFPGKKKKPGEGNDVVVMGNNPGVSIEGKPGDEGYYQINSYDQPHFFDANLKSTKNTLPLANVKVKLVIRYILNGYELINTHKIKSQVDGYLVPENAFLPDNGKTLAITYTDGNGNYQFNYHQIDSMLMIHDQASQGFGTSTYLSQLGGAWENKHFNSQSNGYFESVEFAQAARVLRLEVESSYYCSPEVNIMVQPGQTAQVPTQVSEVRNYHLRVHVYGDSTKDGEMTKHEPVEGVMVEVLRGDNAPADIPENEGQEIGEPAMKGWKVISRSETNHKGNTLFGHLVLHDAYHSHDRYRIRAYSKQANTLEYYESDWNPYPVISTHPIPGQPYSGKQIFYNSEYSPQVYDTEMILQAGNPKIRGRVMQIANRAETPLDSVKIYLILSHTQGKKDQFNDTVILSDADGYFEFDNLPPDHSGHISFYRKGYHHEMIPVPQLLMGDLFLPNDGLVKMVPLGKVYGYVSNEVGEPIPADVRAGDGPLSPTELVSLPKTWKEPSYQKRFTPPQGVVVNDQNFQPNEIGFAKQRFMFGAESGQNIPLRIEPFSDKYFPLDTVVNIEMKNDKSFQKKADYQFLGEFQLKEKLHRVRFVIKDKSTGQNLPYAEIEIQDTILLAQKGIKNYAFASPGQFFLVKVIPPSKSDYVIWYEEVEIPISPDYQLIEIELRKGKQISGFVTAGSDSLPLAGAKVFVKNALQWSNDFPISEAITDQNGYFTLKGIPADTVYTAAASAGQNNGIIYPAEIHAVKSDPLISYIGDKKSVSLTKTKQVNFHLDIIDHLNLTEIWGFPIEIEEFTPNGNVGGKVSGAFVNLPENENFSVQDPNVRLSFHKIDVFPGSKTDANGVPIAKPAKDEILTDQTSLLVDVYGHYSGKMYSRDYYSNEKEAERIVVSHDGAESGLIHGNIGILLSSFNFSYQYSGKLILADNPDQTTIPVFSAKPLAKRSYNLVDYKRGSTLQNPKFKVHNFHAHADRAKSYIYEDSVHLFTVLHTNIPDSKPADLKIEAGEIIITPNDILPFSSGEKLTFYLEEWQVVAQSSWYYSKSQGAIFIAKAMVHTGVVDVPVEQVRLQPDDIDIDDPDLQKSGLSLGGVVPLQVYTSNFIFGYDTKCASDLKPHWKLRLINEGSDPVAMFTGLPGAENHQITLDHITLYSNGEQIVGGLNDTVRFYNIMDMHLSQIATGKGFFKLRGRVDFDIPHLSKDLSTDFTYTNGPGGTIKGQWEPLSFMLDTKGKVEFTSESSGQILMHNLFHAKGNLRIYGPDGEINLKGQLMRTAAGCNISVIKINGEHQTIQLGDPNNVMRVLQGKADANIAAGDWGKFSFDARLEGFKGIGEGDSEMTFVVDGAIKATNQDISVTGIETPLGDIKLTYNFKEQSLFGSMHVNNLGIGAVEVQQGDFQILMDRKGYYFLLGATVKVPIVQEIGMAILVGDYPEFNEVMRTTFESYSYNHNIPKGFEDGFSGFLFNGKWEYDLLDNDGIDLVAFSIYATAKVGLDLRISADFSSGAYELYVLGYGNFGLEISAFCVTGFFMLNAELGLGAQIVDEKFDLVGCASIQAGVGFEACVPVDPLAIFCLDACISDCWTGSIKADMVWGESSSLPSFDVSFGETCSNNSDAMSIGNKSNNPCN